MTIGKLHFQNVLQSSLCLIGNLDIRFSGKDLREKPLLIQMENTLLLSLTTDIALTFQYFNFWTHVSQLKRHSELPSNYWKSIPLKDLKVKIFRNSPEVIDLQKWAPSAQSSEINYRNNK